MVFHLYNHISRSFTAKSLEQENLECIKEYNPKPQFKEEKRQIQWQKANGQQYKQ